MPTESAQKKLDRERGEWAVEQAAQKSAIDAAIEVNDELVARLEKAERDRDTYEAMWHAARDEVAG